MFTPKFGKKNAGTRSFQDCVIKESIKCESVSADLDVMAESTILWMTSADDVNRLYLSGTRKMCRTPQIRKNWGLGYYYVRKFSFILRIVMSRI